MKFKKIKIKGITIAEVALFIGLMLIQHAMFLIHEIAGFMYSGLVLCTISLLYAYFNKGGEKN